MGGPTGNRILTGLGAQGRPSAARGFSHHGWTLLRSPGGGYSRDDLSRKLFISLLFDLGVNPNHVANFQLGQGTSLPILNELGVMLQLEDLVVAVNCLVQNKFIFLDLLNNTIDIILVFPAKGNGVFNPTSGSWCIRRVDNLSPPIPDSQKTSKNAASNDAARFHESHYLHIFLNYRT